MRFAARSVVLQVLCTSCLAACGATSREVKPTSVAESPASGVDSETDYDRVRNEYDALPDEAKERPRLRAALSAYMLRSTNELLDHGHIDDAYTEWKKALTLYRPRDLRARITNAPLLTTSQRIEKALHPHGSNEEILLALMVELSLTDDAATKARYAEVSDWVKLAAADLGETGRPVGGRARFIDDLEEVSRTWPSPLVVSELTQLYLQPKEPTQPDLREMLSHGPRSSKAFQLMRLYLRVSRPEDGLALLKKLPLDSNDQVQAPLTALLEHYLSSSGQPIDAVNLAMLFAQNNDDRDVAVHVCRDAAQRFSRAPEPRVCAGELARSIDQIGVAILYYEDALRLDPTKRELWTELARLYRQRLFQTASDEDLQLSALEPQLAKVRDFYNAADKQFPGAPIAPSLMGDYLEVGRGYYNGGRPQDALGYLERATSDDVAPMAYELIGQIRTKKNQPTEAIAAFNAGLAKSAGDSPDALYWRARLLRLRAEAEDVAHTPEAALKSRRDALVIWDQIEQMGLTPEGSAELGIERAKLYYLIGERDEALRTFRSVIDLAPDRGATYADELAFLIPRGELEDSLDAYHRALGRAEVTDYLKVYCSLWVLDLARRAGQPEDPLALSYLRTAEGGKWYHDLARWWLGKESNVELQKHATTPARRAELAYYEGLRAWSSGQKDEARALWQQVIATDMMAFFEYDMASLFLRLGGPPNAPLAPTKSSGKIPKKTPSAKPPRKPPEGTI